jgi:2-deoxy-D-gluconate 3-dehydrogenase
MSDLFSLNGKTAIITGGSSGIGAMIAKSFVENGVKTYITSRKEEILVKKAKEFSNYGECIALQSDLSSNEGILEFVKTISNLEDGMDILVNNAGTSWGASIEEFPEQGWDKVMNINLKSIFFLTQKLLPLLKISGTAEDPARVINIASINGITHPIMPTYSYSSSKAAVIQLTRHMGADLAKENININGIAPGYFPSKMTSHIEHDEKMTQFVLDKTPIRRMGKPEDIAGAAIYLSSRASSWVCGETIVVDGGMVAAAG